MFSELQEHDRRKSVTQDRVRDHYKNVLIERDVAAAQSIASKDAIIDKLQRDLRLSTQSLKDLKEDTECLMFAHRQSLRELRSTMGRMIDSKQQTIKTLRSKIVDQGEMCYEMLDEVNDHRKTAKLMKKRADEATKISIACRNKNETATDTIQSLKDQWEDMRDQLAHMHYMSDKDKCRIMELEEETMDLMDTIHVSM